MARTNNYFVCDTETGGLNCQLQPITQIAIVVIDGDSFKELETYTTYVQNYGGLTYDQKALDFTGITMHDIQNGKDAKLVVNEIIALASKYKVGKFAKPIFVGHNFQFDKGFITKLFTFYNKSTKDSFDDLTYDTQNLSMNRWPDMTVHKLGVCCEKAGIELSDGHDALNDTRATASLFISHMNALRNSQVVVTEQNQTKSRKILRFEIQ